MSRSGKSRIKDLETKNLNLETENLKLRIRCTELEKARSSCESCSRKHPHFSQSATRLDSAASAPSLCTNPNPNPSEGQETPQCIREGSEVPYRGSSHDEEPCNPSTPQPLLSPDSRQLQLKTIESTIRKQFSRPWKVQLEAKGLGTTSAQQAILTAATEFKVQLDKKDECRPKGVDKISTTSMQGSDFFNNRFQSLGAITLTTRDHHTHLQKQFVYTEAMLQYLIFIVALTGQHHYQNFNRRQETYDWVAKILLRPSEYPDEELKKRNAAGRMCRTAVWLLHLTDEISKTAGPCAFAIPILCPYQLSTLSKYSDEKLKQVGLFIKDAIEAKISSGPESIEGTESIEDFWEEFDAAKIFRKIFEKTVELTVSEERKSTLPEPVSEEVPNMRGRGRPINPNKKRKCLSNAEPKPAGVTIRTEDSSEANLPRPLTSPRVGGSLAPSLTTTTPIDRLEPITYLGHDEAPDSVNTYTSGNQPERTGSAMLEIQQCADYITGNPMPNGPMYGSFVSSQNFTEMDDYAGNPNSNMAGSSTLGPRFTSPSDFNQIVMSDFLTAPITSRNSCGEDFPLLSEHTNLQGSATRDSNNYLTSSIIPGSGLADSFIWPTGMPLLTASTSANSTHHQYERGEAMNGYSDYQPVTILRSN